jgi:hypothetical protein
MKPNKRRQLDAQYEAFKRYRTEISMGRPDGALGLRLSTSGDNLCASKY